ncbi:hypothetical protein AB0C84_07160 [Actinomadura sp. NPDC048955]|uniref:hypothetical protein n=1 Tax=Actinomadura sp. NPDC048955 TaxID=3158228 RepID=UPI003400B980
MERLLLRWRTRRGHRTAVRFLEMLARAVGSRGWRCVRLYEPEEFPLPVPLLWVYASGVAEDVGGDCLATKRPSAATQSSPAVE